MLTPANLLVITALASLICLAVLGSLARSGVPGIREVVLANVATVTSLLLLGLQAGGGPTWLSVAVANFLYSLGACLYFAGVCRFVGRAVPARALAAGLALVMFAIVFFLYVHPSTNLRIVAASGLHAVLNGALAVVIVRALALARSRYSYYFTLGVTLVASLGHAMRAAVYAWGIDSTSALLQSTVWNVVFLTIGVVVMPSLTLGLIMMIHDRMLDEREREANTDFLTGLLTRKAWWREAERLHAQMARSGRELALLTVDLDRFKQVNDVYGHAAGDAVLQHFALLAGNLLRAGDVIGRMGGEEFSIALPDTPLPQAHLVAQRLMGALRETPAYFDGHRLDCTFSAGLAQCRKGETLAQLSRRADQALYAAKAAGRNQLVAAELASVAA